MGAMQANPLGALGALLAVALVGYTGLHFLFGAPYPRLALPRRVRKSLLVLGAIALLLNYAWVLIAHLLWHMES